MKYAFLALTLLCNYAVASCETNSNLLNQIYIQSGTGHRTAAQEGFLISRYRDQNYCLLIKTDGTDSSTALVYNKNNQSHHLVRNFKKIISSPDHKYTSVFSSEPYNNGDGKQFLHVFDENGIIQLNGDIDERIDSEQYKLFFTADSNKIILHTDDDYMKYFYYIDLKRSLIRKNGSSGKVRGKVRDLNVWMTDFRIIDDQNIMVSLEDNRIIYYFNGETLWSKDLINNKFRVLSIGNKYIVTIAPDDTISYFSRHDGSQFKVIRDNDARFSLYDRLDPNDVRWVAENILVAVIKIDGVDRVFYFDFTSKTITEDKS